VVARSCECRGCCAAGAAEEQPCLQRALAPCATLLEKQTVCFSLQRKQLRALRGVPAEEPNGCHVGDAPQGGEERGEAVGSGRGVRGAGPAASPDVLQLPPGTVALGCCAPCTGHPGRLARSRLPSRLCALRPCLRVSSAAELPQVVREVTSGLPGHEDRGLRAPEQGERAAGPSHGVRWAEPRARREAVTERTMDLHNSIQIRLAFEVLRCRVTRLRAGAGVKRGFILGHAGLLRSCWLELSELPRQRCSCCFL